MSISLERAVELLPLSYPGPGGAVAVLRDGEVLVRHCWGWANAERRIPFTPRSLFRMCSITKQFTCSVVLDAFPDPSELDADVRAHLPLLEQPAPTAAHLCHNQSGLRDYWALAMLHGSPAEAPFGDSDAARVIGGIRTLHFAPGTQNSYVNQNFRILSEPAWTAPCSPPTPPPCRTAPRAMRALPPAASARRSTASSGPGMPGSAPASTT
jgi:D-aminopeptidase